MAYTPTPWGYDVDGELPPLIDDEEFSEITAGKFDGDDRVPAAIAAASASIRNHCGWHVAPSLSCEATLDGSGTRTLWLPATFVSDVDAVTVAGQESLSFQWSRLGEVDTDTFVPPTLRAATVDYEAGYPSAPADLKALCALLVVRSVALSYGVASESVGDTSVSFGGAAVASAGAVSLVEQDRVALMPYRVVKAHAV